MVVKPSRPAKYIYNYKYYKYTLHHAPTDSEYSRCSRGLGGFSRFYKTTRSLCAHTSQLLLFSLVPRPALTPKS